ncbi:MAG: DsbA family oxidoreductase [Ignavibacteriaceae bacterium]|nr:DsbA family oxidoreductase [Ignavibacteriaceae bacterium]
MKIEIWSDVVCPFCYIGKRKFESALEQFPHKDKITVVWKSFQLNPELKTGSSNSINEYLATHKNISIDEAKRLNSYVTDMAKNAGLTFNLDNAVVSNTFNAHRFIHFANQFNKQIEAEESLFRSYFTEGKNIDDLEVLLKIGEELGLDSTELKLALHNNSFSEDVRGDIYEAFQIGVRGVPFFLFNGKHAVSGAQDSSVFLRFITKSFDEWSGESSN